MIITQIDPTEVIEEEDLVDLQAEGGCTGGQCEVK